MSKPALGTLRRDGVQTRSKGLYQRLLGGSRWEAVRDDLRTYVLDHLGSMQEFSLGIVAERAVPATLPRDRS